MKLSIIYPVLNSHEIVRRQTLHLQKMDLSDIVEVLMIDDGSDPPINSPYVAYRTHDTRPWTWALARNKGAELAQGEYLLMTDLDYIITRHVISATLSFHGDYMSFKREFGVLDDQGSFIQTIEALKAWGWPEQRYEKRKFALPPHPNNFVIRRDLFFEMGKYREDLVEKPYPQGEDNAWKKTRKKWEAQGKLQIDSYRPTLYMFPNGQWCKGGDVDTNPFNYFHGLTRKTKSNYWYKHGPKSH